MYKRRINARGIIYRNGEVYAQQLRNRENGGAHDYWCTPGGGVDDGEDVKSAVVREMLEETGVTPEIGNLLMIQQFHDGEKEQLEFFFHITNTKDYEDVDLSKTSHGEIEVHTHGFVDPTRVNLLPKNLQEIDIAALIAEGRTRIFNEL